MRARLAHRGYAASGKRVLRLMRAHGLMAPRRLGPPNGNPAHEGTITTDRPDVMWGTDGTRFYTEHDGWCGFFGAIDHHLAEVVGWHVAKLGDRWAALEPIRQGVRHAFGRFGKDVARGLALRCDWGPQYIADAWINEVKWLGCTISPSYVGEPECNGVAERFMRTLKEQCIYLHQFRSLEEARGSSRSSSRATTPSGSSSGWGIGRRRRRARMPNGGRHEPRRADRREARAVDAPGATRTRGVAMSVSPETTIPHAPSAPASALSRKPGAVHNTLLVRPEVVR